MNILKNFENIYNCNAIWIFIFLLIFQNIIIALIDSSYISWANIVYSILICIYWITILSKLCNNDQKEIAIFLSLAPFLHIFLIKLLLIINNNSDNINLLQDIKYSYVNDVNILLNDINKKKCKKKKC